MLITVGKIRWFVNNSMSPPCLTRPPNCASLFNLIIRIMLRVSWRFSVALIVQLVRFAQGADFLLHFFSHVVVHCVQCEFCAFVCKVVCKCAVCMEGVGAVFARPVIDALGLRQYKWVLTAVKLGCNQALSWDYMHSQMLGNPCTQAHVCGRLWSLKSYFTTIFEKLGFAFTQSQRNSYLPLSTFRWSATAFEQNLNIFNHRHHRWSVAGAWGSQGGRGGAGV